MNGQENDTIMTRKTGVITPYVKELRESLGLTQQQFADEIGTSIEIIQKVEQQYKGLTLNIARMIKAKFDVSLDYLFDGKNSLYDKARMTTMVFRDDLQGSLENVLPDNQECLILYIDEHYREFIQNILKAGKQKSIMSDKLYAEWMDELERGYNEKLKGSIKGTPKKYLLVDSERYSIQALP